MQNLFMVNYGISPLKTIKVKCIPLKLMVSLLFYRKIGPFLPLMKWQHNFLIFPKMLSQLNIVNL